MLRQVDEQRAVAEHAGSVAKDQRAIAEKRAEDYRWALYFSCISRAEEAHRSGNAALVRMALRECPEDLRGWEWRHLWYVSDQSRVISSESGGDAVAVSPDGRCVAAEGPDETIRLWDIETGREVKTLSRAQGKLVDIAFSPDGSRIVSSSDYLVVWDVQAARALTTPPNYDGSPSVAFSPDGTRIASASDDGLVRVWDAATGTELKKLRGHDDWVTSAVWTPDGTRILGADGHSGRITLWDAETGRVLSSWVASDSDKVTNMAISPDGKWTALGAENGIITVWDAGSGAELVTFQAHDGVMSVAFSPDSRRLVSGGGDGTIKVWEASTGNRLATLCGHEGGVWDVSFLPDGRRVASVGNDRTVRLWDTEMGTPTFTLDGAEYAVAFSPDGKQVASCAPYPAPGHVSLWDSETGAEVLTLRQESVTLPIAPIAYSPDGKRIAVIGTKEVTVRDAASGRVMTRCRGHRHYAGYSRIAAVSFSPDGTRLATAGRDTTVKIWDVASGSVVMTLRGHNDGVSCVQFSPDGRRLASSAHDRSIIIWDTLTGARLLRIGWPNPTFRSVAFSPDGRRIVAGGWRDSVKMWDAATGAEVLTIPGESRLNTVAFSPDGRRVLVIARFGETLSFWDAETGHKAAVLHMPPGTRGISGHAFSPDGKTLAVATKSDIWSAPGTITFLESATPPGGYGRRRIQKAARKLVTRLLRERGYYGAVRDALEADGGLEQEIREAALKIVDTRGWLDRPKLLDECQEIASDPHRTQKEYRSALEKAEKAQELGEPDGSCLTTLGIAQYRVGAYEAALESLRRAQQARSRAASDADPDTLAFVAMALYRLDRPQEARAALRRSRDHFKAKEPVLWRDTFPKSAREAERLFVGDDQALCNVWEAIEESDLKDLDEIARLVEDLRSKNDTALASHLEGPELWLSRRYYNRALCRRQGRGVRRDFAEVLADYEKAVRYDPTYPDALNDLAWLRATYPESILRDGKKAVEAARKACEETASKDAHYMATLAAACSEAGNFSAAVKHQQEAIGLLSDDDRGAWLKNYEARLRTYQSGKAFCAGDLVSFSCGGLVARWTFDRVQGRTITEASGKGHSGKLGGGAQIARDPERGSVLSIAGDGGVVCGEEPAYVITASLTVACWVKVRDLGKLGECIVAKEESDWALFWGGPHHRLQFFCAVPWTENPWRSGIPAAEVRDIDLNDGRWHHVAGTYDGNAARLFVDGVPRVQESLEIPWQTLSSRGRRTYIGTHPDTPGTSWNGWIDDVRIYSRGLSEGEIRSLSGE
jgi:WD40 repeat protein/tetratricopeptide (TPR) repeat protein